MRLWVGVMNLWVRFCLIDIFVRNNKYRSLQHFLLPSSLLNRRKKYLCLVRGEATVITAKLFGTQIKFSIDPCEKNTPTGSVCFPC